MDQEIRAAELALRKAESDLERVMKGPNDADLRRSEADVALAQNRVDQTMDALTRLTNSSATPQVQSAEQAVRVAQENLQAARQAPPEIAAAQLLMASARGRSEREREAIQRLAKQQVDAALLQQQQRVDRAEADLKRAVDRLIEVKREPDREDVNTAKQNFETALQALGEARERQAVVQAGPSQLDIDVAESARDGAAVALQRAESRRAALETGPPVEQLRATQAAVTGARAALRVAETNAVELTARQQRQAEDLSTANARRETLQAIMRGSANLAELAAQPDADPDIVELAQADAELAQARSQVAALTSDPGAVPLIAPAAGIVTAVLTGSGETLEPGNPALTFVRASDLVVQAALDNRDQVAVSLAMPARVRLAASTGAELGAIVSAVNEANGGRTTQVRPTWTVPLPPPGTEAQVVIQVGRREQALLVPIGAIQVVDGQHYVTVMSEAEQRRLIVTTGLRNNTDIEIVDGVQEGQLVLVGEP